MRSVILIVSMVIFAGSGFAQTVTEEAFLKGFEKANKLMERRKWKSAKELIRELLKEHESRDYVFARRSEIENCLRNCMFREGYKAPDPKELVSGKLVSYRESSGSIKLRYTPKNLGDFVDNEKAEFDLKKLYIHPALFTGPYAVELKGKRYPTRVTSNPPMIYVCLEGEDAVTVSYGTQPVDHGRTSSWYPPRITQIRNGKKVKQEEKDTSPVTDKKPFHLKVEVGASWVTAYYNKQIVVKLRKPKSLFGRLGFSRIPFSEVTIRGKVEPAWLQGIVDKHEQEALAAFEERYTVEEVLPGWLWKDRPAVASGTPRCTRIYPGEPGSLDEKVIGKIMGYIEKEKFKQGLAYVKRCKGKSLTDEACLYFQAVMQAGLSEFEDAYRCCSKVCVADGEFYPARRLQAVILARLNRTEEALEAYRTLDEEFPAEIEHCADHAKFLFELGRLEASREVIGRAIVENRSSAELEIIEGMVVKALEGPSWSRKYECESDHYHIFSNISQERCYEARRILEEAYTAYIVNLKRIKDIDRKKFRVYLFAGEEGFKGYCENVFGVSPDTAAGLYSPALQQLLIWNLPDSDRMMRTVRHEGFHQYLDRLADDPPTWFNEGLAEYYENAERVRARWKLDRVHPDHKWLIRSPEKLVPLEDFLHVKRSVFYGNGRLYYGQSWAFIYFLRHHDKRDRDLFKRLFEELQGDRPGDEVVDEVFGDVDLKKMDEEFRAFLAEL